MRQPEQSVSDHQPVRVSYAARIGAFGSRRFTVRIKVNHRATTVARDHQPMMF
jgi:hypothetical protein